VSEGWGMGVWGNLRMLVMVWGSCWRGYLGAMAHCPGLWSFLGDQKNSRQQNEGVGSL
jgi:hypothetical protein